MDIIDSFVVSLNLDARQYKDEIKNFRQDLKQTDREAAASSKAMDRNARNAAQSFRMVRNEVVGLFLAFAGASSLKGFVSDILNSDAATGRFADNIGAATEKVNAWQEAIKTVHGSPQAMDASIQALTDTFQNAQLRGDYSKGFDLAGLGLTYKDLADPLEAMLKLAAASERMSKPEFRNRAMAIGINGDTINLLEQGRSSLEKLIAAKQRDSDLSAENARKAQEFQAKLADLETEIIGHTRPVLDSLLDGLLGTAKANDNLALGVQTSIGFFRALAGAIGSAVDKLREYMGLDTKKEDDPDTVTLKKYLMAGQLKNAWLWSMHLVRKSHGMTDPANSLPPPPPGGSPAASPAATGGTGGGVAGFTGAQTQGILAGLYAESELDEHRVNPTSGAYGLGQWLGPRKKALFAKYGPNPTRHQQFVFLLSELQGNANGGDAIRGAKTAEEALALFINLFERPGAGARGDMARGLGYLHGRAPRRGHAAAGASNVSHTTSVGQITVVVPNGDADSIAKGVRGALAKHEMVVQANTGLQ